MVCWSDAECNNCWKAMPCSWPLQIFCNWVQELKLSTLGNPVCQGCGGSDPTAGDCSWSSHRILFSRKSCLLPDWQEFVHFSLLFKKMKRVKYFGVSLITNFVADFRPLSSQRFHMVTWEPGESVAVVWDLHDLKSLFCVYFQWDWGFPPYSPDYS